MMKVALPIWQGRISPVFDVAGTILLAEFEAGREHHREVVTFTEEDPHRRAARLASTGTDILICGAISWPLEMAVTAAGIEVIPQTCGEVDQVLAAFSEGRLTQDGFLMPGCCGRRRRARQGRGGGWQHGTNQR